MKSGLGKSLLSDKFTGMAASYYSLGVDYRTDRAIHFLYIQGMIVSNPTLAEYQQCLLTKTICYILVTERI